VPVKDKENRRGSGKGAPDTFHDPVSHNANEMPHYDSHRVERGEAMEYRMFRSSEAEEEKIPNSWRPLELDPTMRFMRERSRHLVYLVGVIILYALGDPAKYYERIKRIIKWSKGKVVQNNGITVKVLD
jgi:hypothetical protein